MDQPPDGMCHVLGRELEFLEQSLARCRCPEPRHADHGALVRGPARPSHRSTRLDRYSDPDRRREYRVTVALRLRRKELPRRHRHHPGANSVLLQQLGRGEPNPDLGAGPDDYRAGLTAVGVAHDVRSPPSPFCGAYTTPSQDWELLPSEHEDG